MATDHDLACRSLFSGLWTANNFPNPLAVVECSGVPAANESLCVKSGLDCGGKHLEFSHEHPIRLEPRQNRPTEMVETVRSANKRRPFAPLIAPNQLNIRALAPS
jgi:hypothetical protein